MKLGLDIHGVIDTDPLFFSKLTKDLISTGWEVHIITGPSAEKVKKELSSWNIFYTHIFSILDHHISLGTKIDYVGDKPYMDAVLWDRTKGDYCYREGINLHLDDTERYKNYFKTPFSLFNKTQVPLL